MILFIVLSFCLFYYIVRCFIVLIRIVLKQWTDSYDDHRDVLRLTKSIMRCVPLHRNVEDVHMQCHADELMCMIWCVLSMTFEYSRYQQVNCCMHRVLQWDQLTTPVKDAIKKPLTSCRAHGIMRMMWCIGGQSSVSQLTSCFMILPDYKAWFQIRLHHVERMRSCASTNAYSNKKLYNA